MKKLLLIVACTLLYFTTVHAQSCSELFISKYVSMGSNNKCIEIYNPTSNPILLTGNYYLARYKTPTSAGNTAGPVPSPPNHDDTLWLKGTVPSYSTWVICNPETGPNASNFGAFCYPALRAHANQLGNIYGTYGASVGDPTYFKGSDAIVLQKKVGATVSLVDIFGRFGDFMASTTGKPSAWSVTAPYTGGAGMGQWITKGFMMERKKTILTGVTVNPGSFNPLAEYDTIARPSSPSDTIAKWNLIGSHVCDCKTIGIHEYGKQIKIALYPNPISEGEENIHIESSAIISMVSIYGTDGKLILAGRPLISKDKRIDLKINELPTGLYIVKVNHEDGSIGVTRFTKI